MKRNNSTWDKQAFVDRSDNTWVTLHEQAVNITQIDGYDNVTQHHILLTNKNQVRTLISLLQAAMNEYED
jgi:hypothetical protein